MRCNRTHRVFAHPFLARKNQAVRRARNGRFGAASSPGKVTPESRQATPGGPLAGTIGSGPWESSKRNQEVNQTGARQAALPTRDAAEFLDQAAAAAISSLIGIGCQSGDTVMGLSAVRRVRKLAYLFASPDLAAGTWKELGRRRRVGDAALPGGGSPPPHSGLGPRRPVGRRGETRRSGRRHRRPARCPGKGRRAAYRRREALVRSPLERRPAARARGFPCISRELPSRALSSEEPRSS